MTGDQRPDDRHPDDGQPEDGQPDDAFAALDLAAVEAALRSITPQDRELAEPPGAIWAAIESRLAADEEPAAASAAAASAAAGLRPATAIRRRGRVLAAVAAVAVLAIGVAAVVRDRGGDRGSVVASATLAWDSAAFDPLGRDAAAGAQLVKRDGRYELRLVDAELPQRLAGTADLELWLISLDANGAPADIAPIALVDARRPGIYRVPAGVDPSTHVVVDISIEPRDGDAKHSGRSILRGPLRPV